MYKLKQLSEDFVVNEISDYELDDSGRFAYYFLEKKNQNTLHALKVLAETLHIEKKRISFAGNKDKTAITTQAISIENGKKEFENVELNNISLKYLGRGKNEIFLGKLKGNQFEITIRNLEDEDIIRIKDKSKTELKIPNFYGPQRFSEKNKEIGKALIKNDFKEAITLILETNSDFAPQIQDHLRKNDNDFVGALQKIPIKLLKLYVHAYQSYLFNTLLEKVIGNKIEIDAIPLIGFGTELNNKETKKIIEELLQKENVQTRDFIIRQIPELSIEGDTRKTYLTITDFKILKEENDELNQDKRKITVAFSLPKGAYATVLIENLMQ